MRNSPKAVNARAPACTAFAPSFTEVMSVLMYFGGSKACTKRLRLISPMVVENAGTSDSYLLDFVQGNIVPSPIIELRRAWAFMRGHRLGVFERAASLKIGG